MDLEILESIQKKILSHLNDLPDINAFYLTGGTALSAFYLGHRKSNDLDFFTNTEELILPFSFNCECRKYCGDIF
jgi:predicted nucleotidyltransferase component of viral defense system